VQYCTDGPGWLGQNVTMGLISFYHHKAERCAKLAKDEVDPRRRFQLESEGQLWLQIAVAEENLDELRKKAKDQLNGQPLHVRGTG
jgi:hypothetical protein